MYTNNNNNPRRSTRMSHCRSEKAEGKFSSKSKNATDFSKVGGLSNHIKILRDLIIVPLLYNNVYSHFSLKTPRGVLFYGPPGTGKTLVAGALATEINKEGLGRVSFYQRKGADVLDKWVGESERKLRQLFENATKNRPAIIFFDELDGLAPIRSSKNDHVHCSIVTTLLALMDGLDSVPGVIVIGATNRIETVDPALRRPGRFDRELYFPLPSTDARKEILQVHTKSWNDNKPSSQFITRLSEITTGFCGSDLQALCAETLLCSLKRLHPNIQKPNLATRIKIEAEGIQINEGDFLKARRNMIPSSQRLGNKMRKLSFIISPLLQRQLSNVITKIQLMWPHFSAQFYKYLIGTERYMGRIILNGSHLQGLNTHIIPAILQYFEHLPSFSLDAAALQNRTTISCIGKALPSVLILPRIDDFWNCLDLTDQAFITSTLEDIHSGLPMLVIATCEQEIPSMLQNFFYDNSVIVFPVENPTTKEVEDFFTSLFFGDSPQSLNSILAHSRKPERNTAESTSGSSKGVRPPKYSSTDVYKIKPTGKIRKARSNSSVIKGRFRINENEPSDPKTLKASESLCTICGTFEKKKRLMVTLTALLNRSINYVLRKKSANIEKSKSQQKCNCLMESFRDSADPDKQKIYCLWHRTVSRTASEMPVAHLEVLYDTIAACISIHKENFKVLVKHLEDTLSDFENSN